MRKKKIKSLPEAIKKLKFEDSQRIILCGSLYTGWKEIDVNSRRPIGKPHGMWYGVGSSWIDWCLSEQDNWIKKYVYEVQVDQSIMLVVDNLVKFEELQNKYKASHSSFDITYGDIDWNSLTKDYAGIEIAPYFWEKRLLHDSFWYYGWDVASGVIWDEKALISRNLLYAYNNKTGIYNVVKSSRGKMKRAK